MKKRANGEGSIWLKPDGRWCGATYAPTNREPVPQIPLQSPVLRRDGHSTVGITLKGRQLLPSLATRAAVHIDPLATASDVVKPNRRPKTYQGYELAVHRHFIPVLGRKRLTRLSVTDIRRLVQVLTDQGLAPGWSSTY